MSRKVKERLKTICIFILIVAGALQVGILWGYQSQGTPISFLLGFFNRETPISDAVAREKLFIPDRLILSDGGLSHWIIERNSDFYDGLWDEAKQGLVGIASGAVSLKVSSEKWGDLAEKRGFIIDFGYTMKPELLNWFLGVSEKNQELPDVYKLMVKPDIVNENTSTFYIYTSDDRVYISEPISYEGRVNNLEDILLTVSEKETQNYRNYHTFRGDKIDETMSAEPDVLYVVGSPKYWPYFEYSIKPPAKGKREDELAEIVLGNEKDRYNKSYNEDTIQFSYGDNIYRYYTDGFLTYRYLGSTDSSGNGEIGKALLNAYKFVARINDLSETTADIVLTAVEDNQQGIYSFRFDYRLKGMPVKMEMSMKDDKGKDLSHAINIQANDDRVLKCEWLLRDFVQGIKRDYNDRFLDMDLLRLTGIAFEEMYIKDMRSGYYIDSTYVKSIKPKLLIDMKDKSNFQIEMPPEKGD